jgi:hypothetical protein
MAENWDSYFCNVNDVLASILLNLELHKTAPDRNKPNLLWIWVYMKAPREDGLSSSGEFDTLCGIEDRLTKMMANTFDGEFCGRITTDGRREFYYYAPHRQLLEQAVEETLSQFKDYKFDCGSKQDPNWSQYLGVLYPLEYRLQSILDGKEKEYPKGVCIVRFQSVKPAEIDDAVIELFRLAQTHRGDYDGWETQVNPQ